VRCMVVSTERLNALARRGRLHPSAPEQLIEPERELAGLLIVELVVAVLCARPVNSGVRRLMLYEDSMEAEFQVIRPDTWETTRSLSRRLIRWAFRGHGDASWGLDSTLHRGAQQFGCPLDWLADREAWMLRQFQRRAHHYINDPPSLEQRLEWLALIQHYGGPTRLLDFSHSFYVAAFFAIERAINDAAIWAVNLDKLEIAIRNKSKPEAKTKGENIDKTNTNLIRLAEYYLEGNSADELILHVEPDRMNERLSIQQGLFMFPCDVSSTFEDNLASTFEITPDIIRQQNEIPFSLGDVKTAGNLQASIVKIVIPRGSHKTAMSDLNNMNITSATLFPGLDGFARSLLYHLRIMDRDDDLYRMFV
jgi:FRG domain